MNMKAERIEFESLNNTRDLSSLVTIDGHHIKKNKLIRSGSLFHISENDRNKLKEIIDTVIDFRTEVEASEKPDPSIDGVKLIHIEVMGNKSTEITREKGFQDSLIDLMKDQEVCKNFMIDLYKGFLNKSCLDAYRKFFNIVFDKHEKGILFHCSVGKDRTGFAAILLEYALGVSKEDIIEDYMYTKECSKERTEYLTNYYINKIGEDTPNIRKAVENAFDPQEEYLDILFNEIDKRYGDMNNFLEKEFGLNQTKIKQLKHLYLE